MSDAPVTTPKSLIARKLGPEDVGARGYLKWLQISMPALYRGILPELKKLHLEAKAASPSGLGAFGEAQTSFDVPAGTAGASSSWTDNVQKLIQAWGQFKLTDAQLDTVKEISRVNLQRAQAGLAPLPMDASEYGLAPAVKVGLTGDTQTLVTYGAIGLGLLFVLNMLGKRRAA